ncbi:MAG: peptidoglycan-binding protein [Nitrospira sp.]|nr:peptidoglycan-binding protein [Nitrospira sp.]
MPSYQRGSKGNEVRQIQSRLKELGFYTGLVDGDFGGGTESAIKSFQKSKRLTLDGVVGPATWAKLFPKEAIPAPAIHAKPVAFKCLALTGSFETNAPVPDCFAGLSGDFDGQGMSMGVCQWNIGQGSLQPLLKKMDEEHREVVKGIFHDDYPVFAAWLQEEREAQLEWIRGRQDPRHRLDEPWRGYFKALGRTEEFQQIQTAAADRLFKKGLALRKKYSLTSDRAAALMFDILVQNGSIGSITEAQIKADFASLNPVPPAEQLEVERMKIVANRRAEAAKSEWMEDVRRRKLTIATGEGTVHGRYYNLAEQYGLGLTGSAG